MTTQPMLTAIAVAIVLAAAPLAPARAEDPAFTLTIKDHRFDPATIEVPAGQKIRLTVRNQDATPEEFDSYDLNREKVIAGGSEGIVYIGPLNPGTYEFMGEYNADTAQGKVVAK